MSRFRPFHSLPIGAQFALRADPTPDGNQLWVACLKVGRGLIAYGWASGPPSIRLTTPDNPMPCLLGHPDWEDPLPESPPYNPSSLFVVRRFDSLPLLSHYVWRGLEYLKWTEQEGRLIGEAETDAEGNRVPKLFHFPPRTMCRVIDQEDRRKPPGARVMDAN